MKSRMARDIWQTAASRDNEKKLAPSKKESELGRSQEKSAEVG
jgi:hypothetical protein